jgi:hypothetical protein
MKLTTTPIARAGRLIWDAASGCAGPYYLGTKWQIFAAFGSRTINVERPGTAAQREAFHTSRAAFRALRDLPIDWYAPATELSPGEIRAYVKAAARIARAEYKRWEFTFGRLGYGASYVNRFEVAVTQCVENWRIEHTAEDGVPS